MTGTLGIEFDAGAWDSVIGPPVTATNALAPASPTVRDASLRLASCGR